MNQSILWMRHMIVYMGLASLAVSQQTVPDQACQALHLIASTTAEDEKKLLSAMDDFNRAAAKGGCPPCIYHLWKTYGQQSGPFTYLWISSWPDRATYVKVHTSAKYNAATNRHSEIGDIVNGLCRSEAWQLTV
jgi:hypothetical protein